LQAAAELSDEFVDGAYFVPLAPLRSAAALRDTVATTLELGPEDDVVERMRSLNAVVVLDNAEHLEGAAEEISGLRVGASLLLVTSRAPLHLTDEHELALDPLATDAAAELFVARAADHGRAFPVDDVVRAVCRRVDNLPLAIELAAARVKLLAPAALLARLDHALPLLEGGARDAPARQRTLRAAIEWSYDLLAVDEQTAFLRLSVFRGTFAVDVAEAVTGAALPALEALVDQSLLKSGGESRLLMLETLREFGLEQLEAAGELAALELRHARYYAARLREAEPLLRGPRTPELLGWFLDEEDNLRAMLDRLEVHDVPAAVAAASRLASYWTAHGRLREGRRRLEWAVANRDVPDGERARALRALADVCGRLGDTPAAQEAAHEAVELAAAAGDLTTLARALHECSWAAKESGDLAAAVDFAEQAWTTAKATGDARLAAGMADQLGGRLLGVGRLDEAEPLIAAAVETLRAEGDAINEAVGWSNWGFLAFRRGEYVVARDRYRRCEALLRAVDHRPALATCLLALGRTELVLGDPPAAAAILAETVEIAVDIGAIAESLRAATWIGFAAHGVEPRLAVRLAAASLALRSRHAVRGDAHEVLEDGYLQTLRESLDLDEYAREERAGELMSLDETYELALSLAARRLDSPA
jgi:predicted ATPase